MNKWCALRTRDKWYKELEIRSDNLSNALTSVQSDSLVLVFPKSTSTPHKSINPTSQIINPMETSQKSIQKLFPTSTVSFEDSLVRLLASLEKGEVLKIPEERSSLNLREYCEQNSLDYSSLRMLRDCSVTTTERLSAPSLPRLMSWGMTVNGKCLTAKITECHRTGSESSLSDILEEHPDPKYFLSEKAQITLMSQMEKSQAFLHHQLPHSEEKTADECLSTNWINLDIPMIESTEMTESLPHSTPCRGGARQPFIAKTVRSEWRASPHGSKQNWDSYEYEWRIRRLTPTECERLQGFPDWWTEWISDTQRYKCLGNAVTVNVIRDIFTYLL